MRRDRAVRRNTTAAVWQKVQTLACQQPESQGRWTVRTLARKVGLPPSTVHAILNASELQLHRVRTFTLQSRSGLRSRNCWISWACT